MENFSTIHKLQDLIEQFDNDNAGEVFSALKSLLNANVSDESYSVIIAFLNKQILIPIHRYEALKLLDELLPWLQEQLLIDYSAVWIKGTLNKSAKEVDHIYRYEVLAKIVETNINNQDFRKCVVGAIPKIIEICLCIHGTSSLAESSLHCLTTCLKMYPSTCGPFAKRIESNLCEYLTLPYSPLAQKAGIAYHHLQQVGGPGQDCINYKNNWKTQTYKLCSTLHNEYDVLFENVAEYTNYQKIDVDPFEFSNDNATEDITLMYITANRIKTSVCFLQSLFSEKFPTIKVIEVQHVLDVIKRGLSVDTYNDCTRSLKDVQFASVLYKHQIDLLGLLKSFIVCYNQNLMIFSFVITKLIMDCSARCQKDYFKNNSEYQEAVYEVLNKWIVLSKNKLCKSVHLKLFSHILSDIESPKENSRMPGVQEALSTLALESGSCLLNNVSLNLDSELYKKLCETVICQLMDNRKANSKISKHKVYLYKMLNCIFNQNYHVSALYLQKAIYIFKNGIRSNNSEISTSCRNGLNVLEKLSQPICPTLSLSNLKQLHNICIPTIEVDESMNDGRSIFYERNHDAEMNGFNKKRKDIVSDDESDAHDGNESVDDIPQLSFGAKKIKLVIGSNTAESADPVNVKLTNQENISKLDKSKSSTSESGEEEEILNSLNNDDAKLDNMEISFTATKGLQLDEDLKTINQENNVGDSLENEEEMLNSLNDVVNEF